MSRIVKTVKTLRTHWKKSTFAAVLVTWGVSYTKDHFETQALMRVYCEKAAEYGRKPINVQVNPRSLTVILNPNANKRKSATEFEKYCAPLLHLAGIAVDIVKTESEGHAKTLMETLGATESIIVAGGDGTLSEVVTGLLRRTNENEQQLVPVGVIPLGKNNSFAKSFFLGEKHLVRVRLVADATMAVIEEFTKPVDVMRIEILNEDNNKKPVYALAGIKWGAYRDAEVKKEKYWYFGSLKKYATYLLNGFQSSLTWKCEAELSYSPPCMGCSNCYKFQDSKPKSKWFGSFIKEDENNLKYQRIHNPYCNQRIEKKISTSDLNVFTSNVIPSSISETETPKLQLSLGPQNVDYLEFVKQGWKTEQGENRAVQESIEARIIEINPSPNVQDSNKELWFSIDNEDYEVMPIRVTLLPKLLKMYCRKNEDTE